MLTKPYPGSLWPKPLALLLQPAKLLAGFQFSVITFEGSPLASLNNTSAGIRNSEGCSDSDANDGDFSRLTPNPRNSASPSHACEYALAVAIDPEGGGSVSRSPDFATYYHGSSVDLTAAPSTGYHFEGWTGDAAGAANPLTVVMGAPTSIVVAAL